VASANPVITNGLVAAYPFNGNADDWSGNGNNGVVNGATLIADRFGNPNSAYSFDGDASIISDVSSASLSTANGVTIALWLSVDSDAEQNHLLSAIGGTDSFYATMEPGNQLTFRPQRNWDNGIGWQTSGSTVSGAGWRHVAVVWNGNSDPSAVDFFLDGTAYPSVVTSSQGTVTPPFAIGELYMGLRFGDAGSEGQPLNGALDEVYLYDRALSASEVQTLFFSVPEPSASLLVGVGLFFWLSQQRSPMRHSK
jgi:hypothetical protein